MVSLSLFCRMILIQKVCDFLGSCSSATKQASRVSDCEQPHSGVSARGQVFVQKCPCMSGRKIIDLAKAQKTTSLIEVCCPPDRMYRRRGRRIVARGLPSRHVPAAGVRHLGLNFQSAIDGTAPSRQGLFILSESMPFLE